MGRRKPKRPAASQQVNELGERLHESLAVNDGPAATSEPVQETADASPFPLLRLPDELLARVAGLLAAYERFGVGENSFVRHHGWTGSWRSAAMMDVRNLALTCRALSIVALDELWSALHFTTFDLAKDVRPALRDNSRWAKVRSLHIQSHDTMSGAEETPQDRILQGLSFVIGQATALRRLSLTYATIAGFTAMLKQLLSHNLRLTSLAFESTLVAVQAEDEDEDSGELWKALRAFLEQQGPTLEVLSLRLGAPEEPPIGDPDEMFDLSTLLRKMPRLHSLDFMPYCTQSWPLEQPEGPIPPLRSLSLVQSRLDWLADGLLPAVAETLEVLSLYFSPPEVHFLDPDHEEYEPEQDYHYLSAHAYAIMPEMPRLDRLSVYFIGNLSPSDELDGLLMSFAETPIRQLWLNLHILQPEEDDNADADKETGLPPVCATDEAVKELFEQTLLRQLRHPHNFPNLIDLTVNIEANCEHFPCKPRWPTHPLAFRICWEVFWTPRPLFVRVRGVEKEFDILPVDDIDGEMAYDIRQVASVGGEGFSSSPLVVQTPVWYETEDETEPEDEEMDTTREDHLVDREEYDGLISDALDIAAKTWPGSNPYSWKMELGASPEQHSEEADQSMQRMNQLFRQAKMYGWLD